MILRFPETTAASAVGTRIVEANGLDTVNYPRLVKRIAVVGSAAAGDAAVDLFLGATFIGRYYTTVAGAAPAILEARDWLPVNWVVDAAEPVVIKISDAGLTNVIVAHIETDP